MMSSPPRKELKAQWKTDVVVSSLSLDELSKHSSKDNLWIAIHGKVYDVTAYARDHPGGKDALLEVAGTDATSAYEDVGHSEDAREIMHQYLVGLLEGASTQATSSTEKGSVVRRGPSTSQPIAAKKKQAALLGTRNLLIAGFGAGIVGLWEISNWVTKSFMSEHLSRGGFSQGFMSASLLSAVLGATGLVFSSRMIKVGQDFTSFPAHIHAANAVQSTNRPAGVLVRTEYQNLLLTQKTAVADGIYRMVFALPQKTSVLGLPIGQHVVIRGYWDDGNGHHTVTRSYTPVSNNSDLGRLELLIRYYADGQLTGKYMSKLQVGDSVEFRGPTGAMRYRKGLSRRLGMIAGGTGITPMYQLIRAICEDQTDDTEISLIYANRSEADILLRKQLDRWAQTYPGKFKVFYTIDKATTGWTGGTGFVTKQVIQDQLPPPAEKGWLIKRVGWFGRRSCFVLKHYSQTVKLTPLFLNKDTKILLCGPPGLVNAAKNNLIGLGFRGPGAVSKMADQVFCF